MPIKKKIFINGELVESKSGEYSKVVNPATEEVIAEVPLCNSDEINYAIESADKAFVSWRETTPLERSSKILELADVVRDNIDELAKLESINVGKTFSNAKGEVQGFIDTLRFFAGAARTVNGINTTEYMKGHTSMVRREPVGVVGSITPWNYPLMMAGWKIGPALAAGNTVVIKPSELTPLTTLKLAEISSGILPQGVLNVVTGFGESVGMDIVKHPKIKMVSLTGSVRAGKSVAKVAADTLKKVHLELGGKAPVIVYEDANIPKVVEGVLKGALANTGQDCTAATRLYVSSKIYNKLVEELTDKIRDVKVGNPLDEGVTMGPVVSRRQLERVAEIVERAKSQPHIDVLAGGNIMNEQGYYFEPTILSGVQQTDEVMQEEIFGPVIAISELKEENDFIHLANDCKYALAASVWTTNIEKAMKSIKGLEFGTVWVNNHLPLVSEMPHGGSKLSGYGNDQSIYSLEEYTEIKHAMIKFD